MKPTVILTSVLVALCVPRTPAQVPAQIYAPQHVRVIDGTGAAPRLNQTLVIENGRITHVGDFSRVQITPGSHVFDLTGRTVLPGLIMLHEHLVYNGNGDNELMRMMPFSAPRLFLALGVTTIRTAGINEPYAEINLKRRIDAGLVPRPEMFVTGPCLNEPEGRPGFPREWREAFLGMKFVRDADDARRSVRCWAGEGVTSIKVYRRVTPSVMAAIVEEAHSHGLRVMGHIRSTTCSDAARLGIDFIEHSFGFCDEVRLPNGDITNDPDKPQATGLMRALIAGRVIWTRRRTRAMWLCLSVSLTSCIRAPVSGTCPMSRRLDGPTT
jgi:imidazolonepropionase-like amidohydrolase